MVRAILDRKVLRDFKLLRVQTLTITILIFSGISLLIASWSAFRSLTQSRDTYYQDYRFGDAFGEFKAAPAEIAEKIRKVPGVDQVEPRIVMDGLIEVSNQTEPAVGRFISLPEHGMPALNRLYLRQGRLPVEGSTIEVVVHEAFAEAHRLRLGEKVKITLQGQQESAKVVGVAISPEFVYSLSPSSMLPDDLHFGVFWVMQKPLERLSRLTGEINSISIKADRSSRLSEIRSELNQILRNFGNRGIYDRSHQLSNLFVEDEISQQRASIFITPLVFLGIASFLIHIILSRLVAIHRAQIATLKSLGYLNGEITVHYLKLIFLMTLPGAVLGILGGMGLGKLYMLSYRPFFHFPSLDFSLSPDSVFIGFVSGILPGMIGGMKSLRSVGRLSPIEAMRPPVPPAYQEGFWEKTGIWKHSSTRMKMVFRNLFSKPVRLFLTILGVSTAVAVIVIARSWEDMMVTLLDTQFQRVRREDMSVVFLKPVGSGGLRELAKVEGVIQVEGYRNVPVRIHFKNHQRELGWLGVPAKPVLVQNLDHHFERIEVPENGLMLSRFFQEKWGMKEGDPVLVEPLEGDLRWIPVTVTGFSDDLVGLNASSRLETLWKVLRESPSYNLATLRIDPKKADQVYVRIKNFPMVASVILKDQLYHGFQKTMGGMIRISMIILMSFALMISIGVIYNSVRVSFSERSWEMASLRVLGFEKMSVFGMMVSEMTTQVILALIPGCLLGSGIVRLLMESIHTESFDFPMVIFPGTFAMAILILWVAFFFSMWAVLGMIRKMNLIEALKVRD